MAEDQRADSGVDGSGAPADRLESWKEIAAYFRRDVRTVQRWEQTDGLPVHRHKRAHRPIPYAYKSELDAWWNSRSESGAPPAHAAPPADASRSNTRAFLVAAVALVAVAAAAGGYAMLRPHASRLSTPKSVAVLPFLDLTEKMKEEEFADGMTEELIDRLNKMPGFRVPAPTSSFYFKGKQLPVADIARTLDVAYVLDGSVRRSGARVRIAARLIRAADGYVVWSESYDRSFDDVLKVQDDIAGEVAKAVAGRT
jgi:transcriptional activator of cad operon